MKENNVVKVTPLKKWSEDLSWQASRAVELGRKYCKCPGYFHLLWSPLRAARFVGGLSTDESIITSTITPHIEDNTRILIAGAADPGQLCAIGRMAGTRTPDITVADRCRAPLELIRDFSSIHDITCRTHHGDIVDLEGTEKWDLIFLHYTLLHVDRPTRGRLFERLRESLAPGGFIVSVDQIGELPKAECLQELEYTMYSEARTALQGSPFQAYWDSTEMDDMLRNYGATRLARRLQFPTIEEIDGALKNAGFSICSRKFAGRKKIIRSAASIELDSYSSSIVVASMDEP